MNLGAFELLIILAFMGDLGLPLGMPPGQADPLLEKIAPKECLAYVNWAGVAQPQADSVNDFERFVAEPEIQRLGKHIDQVLAQALQDNARLFGLEQAASQRVPVLLRALLTHPSAAFLSKVSLKLNGIQYDAGLVVNVGQDLDTIRDAVKKLEAAIGDGIQEKTISGLSWREVAVESAEGPKLIWGFRDKYFIIATNAAALEGILQRVRTPQPQWLTELKERLSVERPASLMYLDVARLLGLARLTGEAESLERLAKALGLSNLNSVACISGLEGADCVSRTLLHFEGEPGGIFNLAVGKPLAREDLQPIPQDATFGLATRLDLLKVKNLLQRVSGQGLPLNVPAVENQFQAQTGVDLTEGILEPLGDKWRLYNSPGEGGFLLTGTTLVVSLDDPQKAAETLALLQKRFRPPKSDEDGPPRRSVVLADSMVEGKKIYYLQATGEFIPFAVALAIDGEELIVSTFPGHLKGYLSRDEKVKSITQSKAIASLFQDGQAPVALCYQNPHELFQLVYPITQYLLHFASIQARSLGVDLDVSLMPSAPLVRKYLRPRIVTLQQTKQGIELTSRQSLPLGASTVIVPMMMAVDWPWWFRF